MEGPDTRAPTSANTVDPVGRQVLPSDTTLRPVWLQKRISAILAEDKQNPIIRILRYDYDGQTVYFETPPCCDQFSIVYNTKGQVVCNPDGGITGKGDGRCPDFREKRKDEKLVWQDPR